MSTFGEMIDRIADDLNRADLSLQIKKSINRAIIYYEKEPFWFKETTDDLSLSANQKIYNSTSHGLASDIGRIHYVEVEQNSSVYELEQKDIGYIQSANPNDSAGFPSCYALWGGQLWFSLVPNESLLATIYYTKKYSELTTTTQTNDWLTYAEDLVESRVEWWLQKRILKNRIEAASAKQEELEALECLRGKNEDQAAQLKVTPTVF